MKIVFKNLRSYNLLPSQSETTKCAEKRKISENSRCFTLLYVAGMILCCLVWVLTTWFRAGASQDTSLENFQCLVLPEEFRCDCYPSDGVDETRCLARGCCWSPPELEQSSNDSETDLKISTPFCYYPFAYHPYTLFKTKPSRDGLILWYKRLLDSGYPNDVDLVVVEFSYEAQNRLRIKIYDGSSSRFEVPYLPETNPEDFLLESAHYNIKIEKIGFGFSVHRKSNDQVLFKTSGGFVFSDQFLQISSLLASQYIYGLGENRSPLLKSTKWSQFSFWNADQWPARGSTNLYGSHPFYLSIDEDGDASGVFLKNSNAIEVILQPTPAITYRVLGGILDFYIFTGPDPKSVIEQYTQVIGQPFLPPYWSLGYHQCKFGYGSLNRTREVLEQTRAAGIPIDVQWNDIDYMSENRDFTVDEDKYKGLGDFVRNLQKEGLHYVAMIDPGISGSEAPGSYRPFDLGLEMDVFIKNSSGQLFVGKVWNRQSTVWPDFTHKNATTYWTQLIKEFSQEVPIDGAWIDMNEPSNFFNGQSNGCPASGSDGSLNNPPYVPRNIQGGTLFYHTVCPSARQNAGKHYDLHNMYGFTEAIVTHQALLDVRRRRPFSLSRSTFPGHGHYGAHWTGDVLSDWSSMKQSITDILNFNMFGIPMVGADICGFNGNTTAALCNRWMQLGAFYPFSRNHNTDNGIDQDPVSLGPDVVKSAKNALQFRYSILPYLYTLMVRAHLQGTPVARPMFFEFSGDANTFFLDEQFMLGDALLVAPVLLEGTTEVSAYLPEGRWYFLDKDNQSQIYSNGDFFNLLAPLDKIPLLARGGTVLPKQGAGNFTTTTESRKMAFSLFVYLNSKGTSSGELFVDDGESTDSYTKKIYTHIKFSAREYRGKHVGGRFWSTIFTRGFRIPAPLSSVEIYGVNNVASIKTVVFNGKNVSFVTDEKIQALFVRDLNADLCKSFQIIWN